MHEQESGSTGVPRRVPCSAGRLAEIPGGVHSACTQAMTPALGTMARDGSKQSARRRRLVRWPARLCRARRDRSAREARRGGSGRKPPAASTASDVSPRAAKVRWRARADAPPPGLHRRLHDHVEEARACCSRSPMALDTAERLGEQAARDRPPSAASAPRARAWRRRAAGPRAMARRPSRARHARGQCQSLHALVTGLDAAEHELQQLRWRPAAAGARLRDSVVRAGCGAAGPSSWTTERRPARSSAPHQAPRAPSGAHYHGVA